jgi:hypothetical protein
MALWRTIDGWLGWLDGWHFARRRWRYRHGPRLFHRGWGEQAVFDAVHAQWLRNDPPAPVDIVWTAEPAELVDGFHLQVGRFEVPRHAEHLPPVAREAEVLWLQARLDGGGPQVVLMPGLCEAGPQDRMPLARALAQRGISSLLLDSPLRGRRAPPQQPPEAPLAQLSDFVLQNAASAEEGRSLLAWLHSRGHRRLAVAGTSHGGYLAAVAGLRSDALVHVAALVSPHSGVPLLLEGLAGGHCDWPALQRSCGGRQPVGELLRRLFALTSLEQLPLPRERQRLTWIAARNDRYVPRHVGERMQRHFGSHAEVRWLPGGHISSRLRRHHLVDAVAELFAGPAQ